MKKNLFLLIVLIGMCMSVASSSASVGDYGIDFDKYRQEALEPLNMGDFVSIKVIDRLSALFSSQEMWDVRDAIKTVNIYYADKGMNI